MDAETVTQYKAISHYRILEKLGEGGMGVVYKAQDLKLERLVALKFLPSRFAADDEPKARFIHEAKAASALDHPNVCTIYEIGEAADGQIFIAMAYYEGETLKGRTRRGPLPVNEAVNLALQIARGLAKAHAQGLVHRDIKPANVIVTQDGVAKIVDFGLAKMAGCTDLTAAGTTVGTAAYMSPEQTRGENVDSRTDVWALGVVLYEMLSGQHPFQTEQIAGTVHAILNKQPRSLQELRPEVPREVERIVARTLEKNPNLRYRSAAEVFSALTDFQSSLNAQETPTISLPLLLHFLLRPRFAATSMAILVALVGIAGWQFYRGAKTRWSREEAIPEIIRLSEKGNYVEAYRLATKAEAYIPKEPTLVRLWSEISQQISVKTNPQGADVYMKEYAAVDGEWEHAGRSPLDNIRIPRGYFRWRIAKEGFETAEGAGPVPQVATVEFSLDAKGAGPPGMVRVPAGDFRRNLAGFGDLGDIAVPEFWIDKFEVTNRKFKEFVDKGGYQQRRFWKHAFLKGGRQLSWEEAIREFRDSTGRTGPSTWEAGTYLDGQGDFPVGGVSWYEAAAYAEFVGKHLPTVFHWYNAARVETAPYFVPFCNFGSGVAQVGSNAGIGAYGTYDIAGNVKEWCWNASGDRRYILGGAWGEQTYMFHWPEPQLPFDRSARNGFRCVKFMDESTPAVLTAAIQRQFRDYSKEKPVSDEVFRVFPAMYSYEPVPLDGTVESTDSSQESWIRVKVSFHAGYGNEKVPAFLFLPKNVAPPFQTVVHFPGANALMAQTRELPVDIERRYFLVRSGRAFLYPIYKGTFNRQMGLVVGQHNRELLSYWVKDLEQAINYLESRSDIDHNKIAFWGHSWGARLAPILMVLEPRLKLGVLTDGGLPFAKRTPEADEINFAPRVKTPMLMVNGRYDFIFPLETSQAPLFRFLATPAKDKKHVVVDSAHDVLSRPETVREILDWLDRYFGRVK